MGNKKLLKYIKLGFGMVIIILGVISFLILPNEVAMQFSTSGKLQNYMPKAFAVIIPIGIYALGFLPNKNAENADLKRSLITSVLAILIQVFALIANL